MLASKNYAFGRYRSLYVIDVEMKFFQFLCKIKVLLSERIHFYILYV